MSGADRWVNRTEVKSETSNRVYVVSQHAAKRYWGCSCPAWRTRRDCKHLKSLGLPGGEQPFEIEKAPAKKKNGFLDGYATYDESAGRGGGTGWRQAFAKTMGLDEARRALGLAGDAGWDEVRRAFHLAATESMARLAGDYEAAVRALGGPGSVPGQAEAVRGAKFRLEAYLAYLAEQQSKLAAEAERITAELLTRIEAL